MDLGPPPPPPVAQIIIRISEFDTFCENARGREPGWARGVDLCEKKKTQVEILMATVS
jgi:hypothetical protein